MKKFSVLVLLVLLLSCRSGSDSDGVRKDVKSTIDNYYSDIRKEGMLASLKYFDSSKQFFWIPPGTLIMCPMIRLLQLYGGVLLA
jgi:hypothetical protein